MYQVKEMTYKEKVKMYKKVSKKKLIEMLINCNYLLEKMTELVNKYSDGIY